LGCAKKKHHPLCAHHAPPLCANRKRDESDYMMESEPDFAGQFQQRKSEVNGKLSMGNTSAALHAAVQNPPLGCKDQGIRDQSLLLVMSVVTTVQEKDIEKHVTALEQSDLDTLMKYIYRGMEDGENSTKLLQWHAYVLAKGGIGTVVRALSERRTV